jgi:hypothetical protein
MTLHLLVCISISSFEFFITHTMSISAKGTNTYRRPFRHRNLIPPRRSLRPLRNSSRLSSPQFIVSYSICPPPTTTISCDANTSGGYNVPLDTNPFNSWATVIDCGDIPVTSYASNIFLIQTQKPCAPSLVLKRRADLRLVIDTTTHGLSTKSKKDTLPSSLAPQQQMRKSPDLPSTARPYPALSP